MVGKHSNDHRMKHNYVKVDGQNGDLNDHAILSTMVPREVYER